MDYPSPTTPEPQLVACPRDHADLKYRNPEIALDDLPLGMYNAYKDAVERGCGHDKVAKKVRMEVRMETTVTELPQEASTAPADESTPEVKVAAKVARKPKTCSECGTQGHNKRTHGRQVDADRA